MTKLLMLKGLSGSGKSTFAKKLAQSGYVRTNKDEMRAMLHGGKYSKSNEKEVLKLRDHIVSEALYNGKSVVVDDTNLSDRHAARLKELANKFGATFETKFFDVPLEECIKRDLQRPVSVGEAVIRKQYNQFLRPKPEVYVPPEERPKAIICDIDGTIAHMNDRSAFEWDKVSTDTVDVTVVGLLHRYSDCEIIIMSGRDGACRPETLKWLEDNRIPFNQLLMRPEGDTRKDSIVKRELFDNNVRYDYQVEAVIDDRWQVCEMWLMMGLKVFNVSGLDRGEF